MSISRPLVQNQARFKYFTAIKSGRFSDSSNLIIEENTDMDESQLDDFQGESPTHVVDDECFVYPLPLTLKEPGS